MASVLRELDLGRLGPAMLWQALDPDVRASAARAMLTSDDPDVRSEAQLALARQLRFRPQFVRKLPLDKRVGYLIHQVRPDDDLAGSLLLALHLGERRDVLATFLDELGVPHEDGLITDDAGIAAAAEDDLARAVATIEGRFAREAVDLYLASLLALDPQTWACLRPIVERRAAV